MNRGRVRIIVRFSAAVPLWHLAIYGLILFGAAFYLGRYSRDFGRGNVESRIEANAPNLGDAAVPALAAPKVNASGVIVVTIRAMKFVPTELEIQRGETVEWRNYDITPHTVSSTSFDSGSIDADRTWRHSFTDAGQFPYVCTFHPDMKGTVIVQ